MDFCHFLTRVYLSSPIFVTIPHAHAYDKTQVQVLHIIIRPDLEPTLYIYSLTFLTIMIVLNQSFHVIPLERSQENV